MKTGMLVNLALVAALFVAPLSALGADPNIEDLSLGSHVYGEKWTVEALKGRTVLVYFWDLG
ncbi:MAG: hypothetical protein ACYTFG_01160 [Planctomycetota bacterium]